jgi:hypothetical protein
MPKAVAKWKGEAERKDAMLRAAKQRLDAHEQSLAAAQDRVRVLEHKSLTLEEQLNSMQVRLRKFEADGGERENKQHKGQFALGAFSPRKDKELSKGSGHESGSFQVLVWFISTQHEILRAAHAEHSRRGGDGVGGESGQLGANTLLLRRGARPLGNATREVPERPDGSFTS